MTDAKLYDAESLDRLLELYLNYINHVPHGEVPQEYHNLKSVIESQLEKTNELNLLHEQDLQLRREQEQRIVKRNANIRDLKEKLVKINELLDRYANETDENFDFVKLEEILTTDHSEYKEAQSE